MRTSDAHGGRRANACRVPLRALCIYLEEVIVKEVTSLFKYVQASVKVLKEVTKTRKVPVLEVPLALTKIKKANLETSSFFETLRGTEFPVRTWMRIFVKVRNRCMIACKSS
uniref:Uncharacterized protein n=1 Tax=Oryza barthii TaxID=65489 RepID=A0A0D3H4A8_9ORYZ